MDINFLFAAWEPSWSCSNVGSEDEEYPSTLVPCFRSTDFTSTMSHQVLWPPPHHSPAPLWIPFKTVHIQLQL